MPDEKTIFQIMMHIGKLLDEATRDALAKHDLHHGQARVLAILKRVGPITQADLARGMHVKPATVTNMLKPMLKRDLISRRTDTKTNRAIVVRLTQKGRRLAVKAQDAWAEIETKLRFAVPDAGLPALFGQLEEIRDALGGEHPKFAPHGKEKNDE